MTEENIVETKEEFVLTDELRKKASEKPKFNILYIGDGDTPLYPFRGETVLKTFATFYERQADIDFYTVSSSRFAKFKLSDLNDINIIWLDNVSDFKSVRNLSALNDELLEQISPKWKETLSEMVGKDKNEAIKFASELNKKRQEKFRIVYALDEFIWEGPVGRSHDIQTVQLMESFINIADTVVVPTPELAEGIKYYKFTDDPNKEIAVIPSSLNIEFFQLFKNFSRNNNIVMSQLRDKPKILIKGLSIPENIEEFIINNYKKFQITICSVSELNDHVMGLISRNKISHIYHWANPFVNKRNIASTFAFERDIGFDFVIHTKPDNLNGNIYEITTGDEDILFSIAYGAIPICGIDHLGYEEDANILAKASGLTFGKETPSKKIVSIIERLQGTPVLFNETFAKCKQQTESRIVTSPFVMGRYFSTMLGKELSKARNALSMEKQAEIAKKQEEIGVKKAETAKVEETPQPIETAVEAPKNADIDAKPDNVIAVDFTKKNS